MMRDIGTAAVSTGSACATGRSSASHVLLSAGLTVEQAAGTIRFSLGRKTTKEDLDRVVTGIIAYCKSHTNCGEKADELSGELVGEAE
jgi:cysteine desulfurase